MARTGYCEPKGLRPEASGRPRLSGRTRAPSISRRRGSGLEWYAPPPRAGTTLLLRHQRHRAMPLMRVCGSGAGRQCRRWGGSRDARSLNRAGRQGDPLRADFRRRGRLKETGGGLKDAARAKRTRPGPATWRRTLPPRPKPPSPRGQPMAGYFSVSTTTRTYAFGGIGAAARSLSFSSSAPSTPPVVELEARAAATRAPRLDSSVSGS